MNILLISLLGCLVVALPSASAQKFKLCVKSEKELKKCQHLTTKSPDLECFLKSSVTDCMESIKIGDADITTVDGENVYKAGLQNYKLHPIIAEKPTKGISSPVPGELPSAHFSYNPAPTHLSEINK